MLALLHSDLAVIRYEAGLVLSLLGFDVILPRTAAEAVAQAARADLIVLGVSSRSSDVISMLARKPARAADVPVVIVTANSFMISPLLRARPDALVVLNEDGSARLRTVIRLARLGSNAARSRNLTRNRRFPR